MNKPKPNPKCFCGKFLVHIHDYVNDSVYGKHEFLDNEGIEHKHTDYKAQKIWKCENNHYYYSKNAYPQNICWCGWKSEYNTKLEPSSNTLNEMKKYELIKETIEIYDENE